MGGALFSRPWRVLPENDEDLKFVKSYELETENITQLRILLHGPVGAGKSSFINSVDSILQKRITGRALTDATSGKSFTTKYRSYKIRRDHDGYYPFIFNDMMGSEQNANQGIHVEDIKLALRGHVKEGYEFDPKSPLTPDSEGYEASPSLDDRVHVLVYVFPADTLNLLSDDVLRKMKDVRKEASKMGIPQFAILTKADQACPEVKNNIKYIYKSKYLKEKVNTLRVDLGLQPNCIYLVKNYESEESPNDDINKPILRALRQIISYGEDFVNDL